MIFIGGIFIYPRFKRRVTTLQQPGFLGFEIGGSDNWDGNLTRLGPKVTSDKWGYVLLTNS